MLIVDVATDDGPAGMGFAFGTPGSGNIINAMITNILAPAIKGGDPLLTCDLWIRMYAEAAPRRGGDGYMRNAIAAVDFALWDIKGKALGVPVSRLFGGHREKIPTYANCAHHMPPTSSPSAPPRTLQPVRRPSRSAAPAPSSPSPRRPPA